MFDLSVFHYDFMRRAFRDHCDESVLAYFGGLLILRRQSLMSDTLSHVSLAGLHLDWYWGFHQRFRLFLSLLWRLYF